MNRRPPPPEVVDGMEITYPADWRAIPRLMWERMRLTPEQYGRMRAARIERERRAPAAGSPAPDFELERLSPQGGRTGDSVRLSSLRGRPVALVFGSYT